MHISFLKLHNFKNFSHASVAFQKGIILLAGDNGNGKTNVIEAIYLLSLLTNIRSLPDSMLAKYDTDHYYIKGNYEFEGDSYSVVVNWKSSSKKQVLVDDKPIRKFASHIGHFPVVLLSPDDNHDLLQTSEERRRMVDTVLCQIFPEYLEALQRYNFTLQQRNAFLKQCDGHITNQALLDIYSNQLLDEMPIIFGKRSWFLEVLQPVFQKIYQELCAVNELVSLEYTSTYDSQCSIHTYQSLQQKDMILQRTNFGTHKDDFPFYLDSVNLKKNGSQGQIKTFLIALKLAIAQIMAEHTQLNPILLLDDIFDKLDENRISGLVNYLSKLKSQIFITDARKERSFQFFNDMQIPVQVIDVVQGALST